MMTNVALYVLNPVASAVIADIVSRSIPFRLVSRLIVGVWE